MSETDEVLVCEHADHAALDPNCPGCNPQGYKALREAADEGVRSAPTVDPGTPSFRRGGYSDVY